tara:strand:+ start:1262 stop:1693 length:432 start_codon:yes stop_codon:yes gene_type:complete
MWENVAKYGIPAVASLWSAFTGNKAQGKQAQYNKMMADIAQAQLAMQEKRFETENPFRNQLLQALTKRQNTAMPRFMPQGMQFSNPYERVNRVATPGQPGVSSFRPANVNLGGADVGSALQMANASRRGPFVANPMAPTNTAG